MPDHGYRSNWLVPILALPLLAVAASPPTQNHPAVSANRSAVDLLDRALAALGGAEAIRRLERLRLTERADDYRNHESPDPGPPYPKGLRVETLWLDFAAGTGRRDLQAALPAWPTDQTLISNGSTAVTYDHRSKVRSEAAASGLAPLRPSLMRLPHWQLLEAREQPESLRRLGGGPERCFSFTRSDQRTVSVCLDGSDRPASIASITADPVVGDTATIVRYDRWFASGGLQWPGRRQVEMQGALRFDGQLEVELREAVAPGLERGADYPLANAQSPPPFNVETLSERVSLFRGLAFDGAKNVMVIRQQTGLVLVQAAETVPASGISDQLTDRLARQFPGTPIRHWIALEHREEHNAGMRAAIAARATVISTRSAEPLLRTMAAAPFRLRPDSLARRPQPLHFQAVDDRLRLDDPEEPVEILRIGRSSRLKESLLVYLPRSAVLMQSTLFSADRHGLLATGNHPDDARLLRDAIRGAGWQPGVIVSANYRPLKPEELQPPAD